MREKTIAISGRSKAQEEREGHERKTSKWKKKKKSQLGKERHKSLTLKTVEILIENLCLCVLKIVK